MSAEDILQMFILVVHTLYNGFIIVILGPSLPELQCHLRVDLDTASYLFFALTLGSIPAVVLSGYLLKRFSVYLLQTITLIVMSTIVIFIPISDTIYLTFCLVALLGAAVGFGLCVILHSTHIRWPNSQRVIHLIFTSSTVGSVMCPVLLEPFLSVVSEDKENQSHVRNNTRHVKSRTLHLPVAHGNHSIINNGSSEQDCSDFSTGLFYPYAIIATLGLPAFMQMYFYFKNKQTKDTNPYEDFDNIKDQMSTKPGKLYLLLMALFFFHIQGLSIGFSSLLTTFGIDSSQNLSIGTMALITSVFWFVFTTGRLLPAFMPMCIGQTLIINVCIIGNCIGATTLFFSVPGNGTLLWLSCVILGLFNGPLIGSGMAWSNQTIFVTPSIRALYVLFMALGFIISNIFGLLMNKFGSEAFVYATISVIVSLSLIYLAIHLYITVQNRMTTHP